MKRSRKRTGILLAVIAAVVLSAIGAYAYWTTTGSGTGTATVAAANGTIDLHGAVADALYPGGASDVVLTADNDGDTNLYVGTVTLASVSADSGHSGCDVDDFSMAPVVADTMVAANTSGVALGAGSLVYANTTSNQDACKGATLTLNLTSN